MTPISQQYATLLVFCYIGTVLQYDTQKCVFLISYAERAITRRNDVLLPQLANLLAPNRIIQPGFIHYVIYCP